MKKLLTVFICLGLCGCVSTAANMNKLNLGMTKQEVIQAMGQPTSTKAENTIEILDYRLIPNMWSSYYEIEHYWVTLQDGKVIRYGRAGDFGSAAVPTQNVNLDVHQY